MIFDKFTKKQKKEEERVEPKKEAQVVLSSNQNPFPYQIIKEPHITEKATNLIKENKYVFKVFPNANKVNIKKAIERLYNVKVKSVRIINTIGKKRRFGRQEGWKPGFKKAIVNLKEGYKIELIEK